NHTSGHNAAGGAIFSAVGSVTVIDSTLSDNFTKYGGRSPGGGIYVRGGDPSFPTPTLTITNSTLARNSAQAERSPGGAIAIQVVATGLLTNSTLWQNSANANGGGVFVASGPLTVTNCTLSGNSASGVGGGIALAYSTATVTLRSSIVAGNSDGFGNPDLGAVAITVTDSLIGNNQGTNLSFT